jgi:hypothetical protein
MAISEIIDASLAETVGNTTLGNFNVPALLQAAADTAGASFSGVQAVRYDLSADGSAAVEEDLGDGDTLAAFDQMVAQNEKADTAWILKRAAAVATVKTITFSGAHSTGHGGSFVINGQTGTWIYASSNADTLTALATQIQNLDGVATCVSDGTSVLTVTADSEWELDISITTSGTTPPTAAVATTTAGHHAGDDIADAIAEDDTNLWYGLCTVDTNVGLILSAAAALEGTGKYLWYQTNEAGAKTGADTTNVASYMAAKNYRCTLGFWHSDTTEFINAAAMSQYFATAPGSIALAHMTLQGVSVDSLTAAEVTTLEGRYMNTYRAFSPTDSAFNMVRKGVRADGKRAEATRDLDYFLNEIRVEGLLFIKSSKKPPYDQDGLSQWVAVLTTLAQRMVREGILRGDAEADQPVTIIAPKFSEISSGNKALYKFAGVRILGQLKNGVLTVDASAEIQIV